MKIRYFSHSAFQFIVKDGISLLIDPFLDHNPTAPVRSGEIHADYIVVTHGHGDHLGDTISIAKRCNAVCIAVDELADYLDNNGCKTHHMHVGGSYAFPFGTVKLTVAHHGSKSPDGVYTGSASGVMVSSEDKTVYHAGDTALFYDMKLIGESRPIHAALLPIGDNYTMGIDDAVKAVELLNPELAIPMHYNTFKVIQADPEIFKAKVVEKGKKCHIMQYGEMFEI